MRLIVFVDDLNRNCGGVEDLLIITVRGKQAALNRAFQQQDDDQAIHNRQITVVKLHAVSDPEKCSSAHNQQRHFLELLTAGNTAFCQHHDNEIEPHHDKPAHDNVVYPVIAVFQVEVDKSVIEYKYLLMKIVGKDDSQHQGRWNQKVIQPLWVRVCFRLAKIIDDKCTQSRNKEHPHIESVPQIANQGMGDAAGKVPFDDLISQPKQQQSAHSQH